MDPKIGVYICSGCGIGEAVDIEDLQKAAQEAGAHVVKSHERLCVAEGLQQIQDDISGEQLNRVVVAACSGRVMAREFDFGQEVFVDRASLREQVTWVQEPNDEDTQMLAQDYVRMSIAKVKNGEAPQPETEEIIKTVMVVGGGIAGLTAARAAAEAGYEVYLVEKEDRLGGWSRMFTRSFPRRAPWTEIEAGGVDDLIAAVEGNRKIRVFTSTTVAEMTGAPGLFTARLQGQHQDELQVGSVIQATGWRPYDPKNLKHLGYGSSPDVVTNVQVEEMLSGGGIKRPSTGHAPRSVAFIQCAGSRDPEHLPYCSAVCCRTSLKQAALIREQLPDTRVFILYKDLRSPAQFELFYRKIQEDEGIFLSKGEVYEVTPNGGAIAVKMKDSLLGADVAVDAEMVVLAAGMVPTHKVDDGVLDKDEAAEAESTAEATSKEEKKEDTVSSVARGPQPKILNLTYRQGTDLPELKYGFPDSHFVCFPYETRRTAIYAAGCVRAPMDMLQAGKDAHGAALKAIQALELTARGEAVHPRARDMSVPAFFLQRCTQCKRCTEECPFGTLDEDEKGTPKPNPTRCRRCGICMGACPERIISFKNYSPNMVSQMIKAIEIPDEEDEKPRYLAFICENDALPALDMAGQRRLRYSPFIRFIPVRCLGSVNTVWIGDALSAGFDGVMLFGCKMGDDYQCHMITGSQLADRRMINVQDKLQQLALEQERVHIETIAIDEADKLVKAVEDFVEEMEGIGMNPFKGF
jgi:quinone-modifying oxidoreductase subunit QmoB